MTTNTEDDWACAMDLANTWAREQQVQEASGLGGGLQLRDLIERLWAKESVARHAARDKIDQLDVEIERLREADRKSELFCKEMLIRCAGAIRTANAIQGCQIELLRQLEIARAVAADKSVPLGTQSHSQGKVSAFKEVIELLDRHVTQ